MRAGFLLALAVLGSAIWAEPGLGGDGPYYTAASIVNAADNLADSLAPYTIATVYGTGMSYTTRAMAPSDIAGGQLPTALPGAGVRVLVGGLPAVLYYVSPTQINFLIPGLLLPGQTDVQVTLDGWAGPDITIDLLPAAPGLFQADAHTVIALHANGSLVSTKSPALPHEEIMLFATGLGDTIPSPEYGSIPETAAPLARISEFQLTLDGTPVATNHIAYAGIAPGFAGLYQVNLIVPPGTTATPAIMIGYANQMSAPGIVLNVGVSK